MTYIRKWKMLNKRTCNHSTLNFEKKKNSPKWRKLFHVERRTSINDIARASNSCVSFIRLETSKKKKNRSFMKGVDRG